MGSRMHLELSLRFRLCARIAGNYYLIDFIFVGAVPANALRTRRFSVIRGAAAFGDCYEGVVMKALRSTWLIIVPVVGRLFLGVDCEYSFTAQTALNGHQRNTKCRINIHMPYHWGLSHSMASHLSYLTGNYSAIPWVGSPTGRLSHWRASHWKVIPLEG